MIQPRSMLFVTLSAALALPAAAAAGRYSITTEQVAAAVSSSGMQITADQVTLPANILASVADPALRVKSIDRGADRSTVARLECANPAQCLPFIVSLRVTPDASALSPHGRSTEGSQGRLSPPVVRAGSPATLLLEGAHVHISLSVVCLESGAVGQTIRASSPDHRQVYKVQVVRDGVLEGRL